MKKIVIIGASGAGKSTLCNVLSGREPGDHLFPVSETMSAGTFLTTAKQVQFVGSKEEVALIDTPGLNDPTGKDSEHIEKMVATLKKEQTVNSFVIVFNGKDARMDKSLKEMLLLFQKMFGDTFLQNTIFEFSRWGYDKNSVRVRQIRGQTEVFWTRELNSRLQEAGLNMRKDVPAIFIDSLHNPNDEKERSTFESESKKLLDFIQNCKAYACSGFQTTKTNLDEKMEHAEEAENGKINAIASLQIATKIEARAKEKNLEMSAISTTECAAKFLSELKSEQNVLIQHFPELLNAAMKDVHNATIKMAEESTGEANATIRRLASPIVKMSESIKLCLRNVTKQDQLINNEFSFYTIREKKYRDDKEKTEDELQKAKLRVKNTKQEIVLAKEKIAQTENGAEEARGAVESAQRKKNETLGWGIPLAILVPFVGVPALTAALTAVESNLASALQNLDSIKNVLPILEDIEEIWTSFCRDQEKDTKSIESDLSTIKTSITETKAKQKTIADLMERVKNQLRFFSILDGKGSVLKNVSAGSLLLTPILNVMLDLVLHIQESQGGSQESDWQREIESVTKAIQMADALPLGDVSSDTTALLDFNDFV